MSNKRYWFWGTAAAVLLILLFVQRPTIQISSVNGSFYLEGNSFELGWIHSVEKEPWHETYERKGSHLVLTETRFKTFGAGTPSEGRVVPSNDGFVHMEMHQPIDELTLTVSESVKTTLTADTRQYRLYKMVPNHETVTISVKNVPLWRQMKGWIL